MAFHGSYDGRVLYSVAKAVSHRVTGIPRFRVDVRISDISHHIQTVAHDVLAGYLHVWSSA